MTTLPVFSDEEYSRAKTILAAKVASMMGRKLEEGDWSDVYCKAKGIPEQGWSNLNIDVNHEGLGVEFKMLRVARLNGRTIRSVCGTTRMHPSATRSIRIEDLDVPPDEAMSDVLTQYASLLEDRTVQVREQSSDDSADMRTGWVLWETNLREFLYFEERMLKPNPNDYYAIWNQTPARGARKSSKSLWIYEKNTKAKKYSVTTSAGIKIQPYFNVPAPDDPNLAFFRVQSEEYDEDTINLWVAAQTADQLSRRVGSLTKKAVSDAVAAASQNKLKSKASEIRDQDMAVAVPVSRMAFNLLISNWDAVNDEHLVQQLIQSLELGS
ncbi:MAG: hypothetical protein F4109_09140 [Gammaproteobacteria bacterium]|nr:hypothetical protein [Gammaproteobacteria bacterium]MYD02956.1 hypothetical protein [Gammaproteobacteria bacterium]MYI25579.1 hypothetical protein [Gammaproteobacteria bacterium]